MTPIIRHIAGLSVALGLVAIATPAQAAMTLCNRTSYVLYAATAAAVKDGAQAQGWTRVVPGGCTPVLREDLTAPAYYLYARSSQAHSGAARAWGGNVDICVKDGNFTSRDAINPPHCASDDLFKLPFAVVDTHRLRSWTATFSESPALAVLAQAQMAGLKRLLRDLGYRIGAIDGAPDKTVDAAMADFRKRLKLAQNANIGDLFDALETEAAKSATPSGYAVCNDTAKAITAALGEKARADWISHGWWKIAAGSCAKMLGDIGGVDSVYLFVQKINGPPLVSGPSKFCVTDIQFDIQNRQHCAARGLNEAGFAETRVKGLAGYAAHIGENGLIKSPARHTTTSK
ncbi:MAG TPA: DUF1036 domain-containing protein [Rhizomicrobium sp.]